MTKETLSDKIQRIRIPSHNIDGNVLDPEDVREFIQDEGKLIIKAIQGEITWWEFWRERARLAGKELIDNHIESEEGNSELQSTAIAKGISKGVSSGSDNQGCGKKFSAENGASRECGIDGAVCPDCKDASEDVCEDCGSKLVLNVLNNKLMCVNMKCKKFKPKGDAP